MVEIWEGGGVGAIPIIGPLLDLAIIFGGVLETANVTLRVALGLAPDNVNGFAAGWGFDSRLGLRRLMADAPVISLRRFFGIP